MQQRRVLGHHRDRTAQGVLRHPADVLTVDLDAAALHVVKAQQQVDQGRLARAGAPDQTDPLTGPDFQLDAVQATCNRTTLVLMRRIPAVEMHDLPEADSAAVQQQLRRLGHIDHFVGLRDGLHALLDHAGILEQLRGHPHDPAGHGVQAQGQRRRRGDRAQRGLALLPEPDRRPDRGDDQHAVQARPVPPSWWSCAEATGRSATGAWPWPCGRRLPHARHGRRASPSACWYRNPRSARSPSNAHPTAAWTPCRSSGSGHRAV